MEEYRVHDLLVTTGPRTMLSLAHVVQPESALSSPIETSADCYPRNWTGHPLPTLLLDPAKRTCKLFEQICGVPHFKIRLLKDLWVEAPLLYILRRKHCRSLWWNCAHGPAGRPEVNLRLTSCALWSDFESIKDPNTSLNTLSFFSSGKFSRFYNPKGYFH